MLRNTWNRIKTIININCLIILPSCHIFTFCIMSIKIDEYSDTVKNISFWIKTWFSMRGCEYYFFHHCTMTCKILIIIIKSNFVSLFLNNRVAILITNIGLQPINVYVYIMDRKMSNVETIRTKYLSHQTLKAIHLYFVIWHSYTKNMANYS